MPAVSHAVALGLTALLVAAIDQLSKAAIVAAIGPGQASPSIPIAGLWLALEYAENRGVAFGLLQGLGFLLRLIALGIVAALLLHLARAEDPPLWETLAIGAICGGAAGNLVDRIRLGYVVDFISVGPWPNFNVADSAITIGAATLIWGWMFTGGRSRAASSD